jgi:putative tricarboxylic transport membrane protein
VLLDALVGLIITTLGVAYWHAAGALPEPLLKQAVGPGAFPRLIAGALVVLGALLVLGPLVRRRAGRATEPPVTADEEAGPAPDFRTMGLVMLGLVVYVVLFERLGFIVSTIIFMAWEVAVMEVERWRWLRAAPVVVLLPVVLYVLFAKILGVTLPTGPLG